MTKILVIGKSGQVGGELLPILGEQAVGVGRPGVDLLRPDTLRDAIAHHRPQAVINAAADTAVDRAETEIDTAQAANAIAPEALARACSDVGARLIHFSTDYVFDGTKQSPYREDDSTSPVNAYGRTKLEGEQTVLSIDPRHVVLRLSWVYSTRGRNFALTMLRLAREGRGIRVVDDQVGSPTYARFIAEGTATLVKQLLSAPEAEGGLFHLTAAGSTSWAGFAEFLLQQALGSSAPDVQRIPSSEFPTPAARPAFSVLNNGKIQRRFGIELPSWEDQAAQWARDLIGEAVSTAGP